MAQTSAPDLLSEKVRCRLVDFKGRGDELPTAGMIVGLQLPQQDIAGFPAYGVFGLIDISEIIYIPGTCLRVVEREKGNVVGNAERHGLQQTVQVNAAGTVRSDKGGNLVLKNQLTEEFLVKGNTFVQLHMLYDPEERAGKGGLTEFLPNPLDSETDGPGLLVQRRDEGDTFMPQLAQIFHAERACGFVIIYDVIAVFQQRDFPVHQDERILAAMYVCQRIAEIGLFQRKKHDSGNVPVQTVTEQTLLRGDGFTLKNVQNVMLGGENRLNAISHGQCKRSLDIRKNTGDLLQLIVIRAGFGSDFVGGCLLNKGTLSRRAHQNSFCL